MLKLPPPVWTAAYILLAAAVTRLTNAPRIAALNFVPVGVALVAMAWIPSLWAFMLFRREGTEINPTSPANRKLVTSGPYRFTRNPMYLGLVVLAAGIAIWVGSWPFLFTPIAVFATANWIHIPYEEAKMRRQFGAEYENYARRVRRWV